MYCDAEYWIYVQIANAEKHFSNALNEVSII